MSDEQIIEMIAHSDHGDKERAKHVLATLRAAGYEIHRWNECEDGVRLQADLGSKDAWQRWERAKTEVKELRQTCAMVLAELGGAAVLWRPGDDPERWTSRLVKAAADTRGENQ